MVTYTQNTLIDDNFKDTSIVLSVKSTSYVDIDNYVEVHITEKSTKETTFCSAKMGAYCHKQY